MKKAFFLVLIILFLCGCVSVNQTRMATVARDNNGKLARLSAGMTKDQAMAAMGTDTVRARCCFWTVKINNPYKTEILEGQGLKFEVLYYYANVQDWDCGVDESDLTPLVFQDGKLIGWGESFLRETTIKYGIIP